MNLSLRIFINTGPGYLNCLVSPEKIKSARIRKGKRSILFEEMYLKLCKEILKHPCVTTEQKTLCP